MWAAFMETPVQNDGADSLSAEKALPWDLGSVATALERSRQRRGQNVDRLQMMVQRRIEGIGCVYLWKTHKDKASDI